MIIMIKKIFFQVNFFLIKNQGPMAVQMGRRHIKTLLNNEYWVTEKSDGIRSMMFVLHEKQFPCWKIKKKENFERINIFDNCALEIANIHCNNEGISEISLQLEDGSYTFHQNPLMLENEKTNEKFEVTKVLGRTFAYVFDRKYQFYLCVDEFLFPRFNYKDEFSKEKIKPLEYQKVILFDGEIVWNFRDKRYNYSIYDIVSFTRMEKSKETGEIFPKIQSCIGLKMKERIYLIQKIVEDYYYYLKEVEKITPPKSLQILCKHFYHKKDISTVLSLIKKDEKSQEYFYKGYNKNDGLVFTPDDPNLYSFRPGSCENLLKWKWPDKLSFDFKVQVEEGEHYLYYWALSQDVLYKNVILDFGENEPLENEGIVECIFDRENSSYKVLCIRKDKTNGNGFFVIANTFENVIENFTIEDLLNLDKQESTFIDEQLVNELMDDELFCTFKLGKKQGKLQLQYQFENSEQNKKNISYNHAPIYTCIGPKNERKEELIKICEEAFTKNLSEGVFARCVFLPQLGVYKIVDFKGRPEDSLANNLLETLESIAHRTYRKAQKRKFEEE